MEGLLNIGYRLFKTFHGHSYSKTYDFITYTQSYQIEFYKHLIDFPHSLYFSSNFMI